jgi:hypothetical protein
MLLLNPTSLEFKRQPWAATLSRRQLTAVRTKQAQQLAKSGSPSCTAHASLYATPCLVTSIILEYNCAEAPPWIRGREALKRSGSLIRMFLVV